jgi:hypothetical protein
MQIDIIRLAGHTEQRPAQEETPDPCDSLYRPGLSADEVEREVGECEEWDEASHELKEVGFQSAAPIMGPVIHWVESVLGAW